MILTMRVGDRIDQREVIKRLADMQYERNETDFHRGTFRVRGDVIDVFPAEHAEQAIRISLFDDEIEGLQLFDPLTGHLQGRLLRFTVFPSSHYVTPRATVLRAIEAIKGELTERIAFFNAENRLVEAQRIEQRTRFDLEMLDQLGFCKGIENYSRHLSGRQPGEPPPTLIDYLAADALMFIDESHVSVSQVGGMYKGDRSRKENLVNYGFPSALGTRQPAAEVRRVRSPDAADHFRFGHPGRLRTTHQGQVVEQLVRPTGLVDPVLIVRPASTRSTTCCRKSGCASRWRSGCW
jgi:excinuclease ABC subunit B